MNEDQERWICIVILATGEIFLVVMRWFGFSRIKFNQDVQIQWFGPPGPEKQYR